MQILLHFLLTGIKKNYRQEHMNSVRYGDGDKTRSIKFCGNIFNKRLFSLLFSIILPDFFSIFCMCFGLRKMQRKRFLEKKSNENRIFLSYLLSLYFITPQFILQFEQKSIMPASILVNAFERRKIT